ncbi:TonB-dependent receptor, partial [Pseudomonas syringae pv. tagetis]
GDIDNRDVLRVYRSHVEDVNMGLSGQLDWQLVDYNLTSITSWRGCDNTQYHDGDRLGTVTAAFPVTEDNGDLEFNHYSQELR